MAVGPGTGQAALVSAELRTSQVSWEKGSDRECPVRPASLPDANRPGGQRREYRPRPICDTNLGRRNLAPMGYHLQILSAGHSSASRAAGVVVDWDSGAFAIQGE